MQVFAQKSVLVVSIYFPLIALISTEPRAFIRQLRQLERQFKSIITCIVFIVLFVVDIVFQHIPRIRANPCPSVGHYISLRFAQKSQLSKLSVSVLVGIF